MSRWINKLIARHLEPQRNVRPLLAGVFHAVSEQTAPFVEEEAPLTGADKSIGDKEKVLREVRKPAVEERQDLRGAEKIVRDERPVLEDKEVRSVKEEEKVFPAADEVTREEMRASLTNEEVKEIPVIQDRVQTQVETRVKYVTREIPVLQELIERERVVEKAPVEEKTVVRGRGEGKTAKFVPGVVRYHNTLNVLHNNITPAPERQTIHVTIGRIEIKAVAPPVETKVLPVKKDVPVMGLDQYLEQRNPAKR